MQGPRAGNRPASANGQAYIVMLQASVNLSFSGIYHTNLLIVLGSRMLCSTYGVLKVL